MRLSGRELQGGHVCERLARQVECGRELCSLNFAQRCRKVELGKATKQVEGRQLQQLRAENADLKQRLSLSEEDDGSEGMVTPQKQRKRGFDQ